MPMTAKRKRSLDGVVPSTSNDDGFDISLALLGKQPEFAEAEGDDDLATFLYSSITERSIKEGTRIVKKAKGREKLVKGEVGGGSFQSMGKWH